MMAKEGLIGEKADDDEKGVGKEVFSELHL